MPAPVRNERARELGKWASWLVVGISAALIPFEIAALVSHPAWARALILIVNGAIVAWLVRYALRQRSR